MGPTIRVPMLMYGKEASNRKQEIDRQHHTIPSKRDQRPKDKHCGNGYKQAMESWISSVHSTWKNEREAFPRPVNRVTHNSKKITNYIYYHQFTVKVNPMSMEPLVKLSLMHPILFFQVLFSATQTLLGIDLFGDVRYLVNQPCI